MMLLPQRGAAKQTTGQQRRVLIRVTNDLCALRRIAMPACAHSAPHSAAPPHQVYHTSTWCTTTAASVTSSPPVRTRRDMHASRSLPQMPTPASAATTATLGSTPVSSSSSPADGSACAAAAAPSEFNTSAHGPGLEIGKDKLSLRYVGDGRHANDVGSIQANQPVPCALLVYYFELTVLDVGEAGRIGLGFSDKHFKLTRQPGWEAGSYGYHGDDGRKYHNSGKGEDYGPRFGAGDTVGAGLHLGRQEIFFTKNGMKLRTAFRNVAARQLYPTVGLHSKHEQVRVNFGQMPFKFDLEALVIEEREQQQAAVQRMHVSAGDAHHVVRRYLLFHGFGATLAAYNAAAGVEGIAQPMCEGYEDVMASTLALRQAVRGAIMAGSIVSAIEQLRAQCPLVLQGHPVADEVQFHLRCQQYIEFIREGRVTDAMQFAQTVLAGLKPGAAHSDSQLRDVVALIAYEQPEASPLGYLLQLGQREVVADAVNAAILQAASAGAGSSGAVDGGAAATSSSSSAAAGATMPQSSLEAILRQLVAARTVLREEVSGGMGEVFELADWLLQAGGASG